MANGGVHKVRFFMDRDGDTRKDATVDLNADVAHGVENVMENLIQLGQPGNHLVSDLGGVLISVVEMIRAQGHKVYIDEATGEVGIKQID